MYIIRSGRRGVTTAKSARSLGPPEPQRWEESALGARVWAVRGEADTARETGECRIP